MLEVVTHQRGGADAGENGVALHEDFVSRPSRVLCDFVGGDASRDRLGRSVLRSLSGSGDGHRKGTDEDQPRCD